MLNPREATPQVRPAEASATSKVQLRAPNKVADQVFRLLVLACGLSLLAIVGLIIIQLLEHSSQSWHAFGFKFFTGQNWDPVQGDFGGLSFVYGTLVSSLLALILAVPVAIGVAVFTTEMCPKPIRGVLSFFTELLAAIPSVIYGLWAIFVLAPLLRNKVEPFLAHYLGWTGLFTGAPYGIGMLAAGVILAIMIVPIISSITREVLSAVPNQQREAALALEATRWEMIRIAVLRNARTGIIGAIILGLGRALGETMAVTMVIGNRAEIAKSLFAPGYTMASVIANEFSEATGDLYLSALVEVGLGLFLVTIIVNIAAGLLVWSVTRGMPARGNA
ncbi:MAG: phosphate ABC transporter permease subunit PstC [Acidobacteria bacterium]|nr:phosphate ABC transporter permease subunit PstC [Acidobacteriota bacterium]